MDDARRYWILPNPAKPGRLTIARAFEDRPADAVNSVPLPWGVAVDAWSRADNELIGQAGQSSETPPG